MWFIVGFGIGLAYGVYLFWAALKDYDELWQKHLELLDEMQRERWFHQSEN